MEVHRFALDLPQCCPRIGEKEKRENAETENTWNSGGEEIQPGHVRDARCRKVKEMNWPNARPLCFQFTSYANEVERKVKKRIERHSWQSNLRNHRF